MNFLKALKISFFEHVFTMLNEKVKQCDWEILQLKESKAADTKSSMGDKYETSGEMIQQEVARWLNLQQQTKIQLQQLEKIQFLNAASSTVILGSLIQTQKGYFFLGLSIGNVVVNENAIYTLSLESPLGKAFLGTSKNENVRFQTHEYKMMDFY